MHHRRHHRQRLRASPFARNSRIDRHGVKRDFGVDAKVRRVRTDPHRHVHDAVVLGVAEPPRSVAQTLKHPADTNEVVVDSVVTKVQARGVVDSYICVANFYVVVQDDLVRVEQRLIDFELLRVVPHRLQFVFCQLRQHAVVDVDAPVPHLHIVASGDTQKRAFLGLGHF